MKKIYLTALLIIGLVFSSNAQSSYWTINWDMSAGMGETGDFVNTFNFRGMSFDGRGFINSNVTIGGFLEWVTLYEKESNLPPYEFGSEDVGGSISGTQSRYLNVFPILVTSHYYFDTGSDTKPYVGIGLGGVYVESRLDLGMNYFYEDTFGFAAMPEVGVYVPFGYSGTGLNLAVRYLYGSAAGDLDTLSMFSFAVGFGFMQ